MTATTVKSVNITALEGTEDLGLHRKSGRLKTLIDQDAIAITSIDEVGDTMLFGPIPSNAVVIDVLLKNDDLDSNCSPLLAVNVGLSYSGIGGNQKKEGNTSGTVLDADAFASAATTLGGANIVWTSVRSEAANITNNDQEAWQVGGLSEDPGGLLYISITVTAAAATDAAGDIVCRVDYI